MGLKQRTAVCTALGTVLLGVLSGVAWAPHNLGSCRTINGTSSGEVVEGTIYCDDIFAKAGSDTVRGFNDKDDEHGEDGHDVVFGGQNDDYIWGGSGDDFLTGSQGDDHVEDLATNDTDHLCGGVDSGYDFMDMRDGDHSDRNYEAYTQDTVAGDSAVEDTNSTSGCPV